MTMTQRQQRSREAKPRFTVIGGDLIPVNFGANKGLHVIRVGDGRIVPGMAGKLFCAPFPHGFSKLTVKIGKEQKRIGFTKLFPHKQQRNMGRKQQCSKQHPCFIGPREGNQSLSLSAVAGLIVVLNKIDKNCGGCV